MTLIGCITLAILIATTQAMGATGVSGWAAGGSDIEDSVTYEGTATYQDENGNWIVIDVEDCEFGCAEAGVCASKWICQTRNIVGWVIGGLVVLSIVACCVWYKLKKRREENQGYQGHYVRAND